MFYHCVTCIESFSLIVNGNIQNPWHEDYELSVLPLFYLGKSKVILVLSHFIWLSMTRFKPLTWGLQAVCSTTLLPDAIKVIMVLLPFSLSQCQWQDSNPESFHYDSWFLPLCYQAQVRKFWFSLPFCLSLNASGRILTLDLRIMNRMFYHCVT